MPEPVPSAVEALAQARARAREARDFNRADALRAEVEAAGWRMVDEPGGSYRLVPRPPFPVLDRLADLPERPADPSRRCGVGLLVEGWADDVRRCLAALLEHAPADVVVVGLDLGDVDGAGLALHEVAVDHPGRIEEFHVAQPPQAAGWGPAQLALLRLDPAPVHVVLDPSTVLDGDALGPLLDALAAPGVVAAGWQGADVDLADGWRSVHPAGPGEVDVLLGYLFALRRDAGLAAPPHPKARFYRNADLEWSLALRAAGGRLVVAPGPLPVHQERHRGYHDSDPAYRDAESRRTYDRLLRRYRGREDILRPRPA